MDITITKLVVPARSRNGRIYTNKTVNQSSGSSGGVTGGGGVDTFIDLTDTPEEYTGQAGKSVTVKADETGVEFTPQLWKKAGTTLSPATTGDKVEIETTGGEIALKLTATGNSALEVNGSVGPVANIGTNVASAGSVFSMLRLWRRTTGTPAAGIGSSIDFQIQATAGSVLSAQVSALLTNVSSITSAFVWKLRSAGAALNEVMRLSGDGVLNVIKRFTVNSYPVAYTIFKQTADKSITNTTTESSLFGTGSGSRTIAGNSLAAGDYIRVNLQGYISTPSSTEALTIRVKYGATTLITLAGNLFSGMTQAVFDLELNIALRAVGSSGSMRPAGSILIEIRSLGYPNMVRLQTTADVSVDTTTDKDIDLTAQWTNALSGNSLITHISTIEIL